MRDVMLGKQVIKPMLIRVKRGKVYNSRVPVNLEESKRIITCCVVFKDYTRGKIERLRLVKWYGSEISKLVDVWIRESKKLEDTVKQLVSVED